MNEPLVNKSCGNDLWMLKAPESVLLLEKDVWLDWAWSIDLATILEEWDMGRITRCGAPLQPSESGVQDSGIWQYLPQGKRESSESLWNS